MNKGIKSVMIDAFYNGKEFATWLTELPAGVFTDEEIRNILSMGKECLEDVHDVQEILADGRRAGQMFLRSKKGKLKVILDLNRVSGAPGRYVYDGKTIEYESPKRKPVLPVLPTQKGVFANV